MHENLPHFGEGNLLPSREKLALGLRKAVEKHRERVHGAFVEGARITLG